MCENQLGLEQRVHGGQHLKCSNLDVGHTITTKYEERKCSAQNTGLVAGGGNT